MDVPPDVNFANGDVGVALETDLLPLSAEFDNVLVTR